MKVREQGVKLVAYLEEFLHPLYDSFIGHVVEREVLLIELHGRVPVLGSLEEKL